MQHIMALIGNGFDISVLQKYGRGVTTSYPAFYSFYKYRYGNKKNILIEQMEEARKQGKENWSDFEEILSHDIEQISPSNKGRIATLKSDLNELQYAFSRFLNDVVSNDIIDRLAEATTVRVAIDNITKATMPEQTYSRFLGDLSEEQYARCSFQNKIDHHEEIKYTFIDFNYTALLDNYLYLDKDTFSPEPYTTSNNNMIFATNPNGYSGHNSYAKAYYNMLPVDIFHPHGLQDVPKSLLFGTESSDCNRVRDERRMFIKSYWARDEQRYGKLFEKVSLFIIYGCSIGASDSWWWNKIYQRLIGDDYAELIIYNYGDEEKELVVNRFIEGCGKQVTTEEYKQIEKHIFVVNHGFNEAKKIVFLQLPEEE